MYYVMVGDRPIGVYPKIFINEPIIDDEEFIQISFWIEKFDTEFQARLYIKQNLGNVIIEIEEI